MMELTVPLHYFLVAAAVLFCVGLYGALRRTNPITILMCIELMLNAVNINMVAFSRQMGAVDPVRGQVFAVFVMTLAAAEVSVGLAIVLALLRRRRTADINDIDLLKG